MTAPKETPANTSAGNIPPTNPQSAVKPVSPLPNLSVKRADLIQVQSLVEETKDPNRHYRWVRTTKRDDDGSVSVQQKFQLGYEIEYQKEGGVQTVATPDSTADGSIRMGDLVLMSCPKVLRQEREADNLHFNERRIQASSETFKGRTKGQRGAKLVGDDYEEREV